MNPTEQLYIPNDVILHGRDKDSVVSFCDEGDEFYFS
jgi:hypothetical protein